MDYMTASKRFDISKIATELERLPWVDLILEIQKQISLAENINISSQAKDRSMLSLQQNYVRTLKKLAYLLENHGKLTSGEAGNELRSFSSLIKRMANEGHIDASILKEFE